MKDSLHAGDKVLVRDYDEEAWSLHVFSHYDNEHCSRVLGGNFYKKLIPYENNEDLLGTNKIPKYGFKFGDFVKIWDKRNAVEVDCIFLEYTDNKKEVVAVNQKGFVYICSLDEFLELNR